MIQTTNYHKLISLDTGGMDRLVASREEARRLLYFNSNLPQNEHRSLPGNVTASNRVQPDVVNTIHQQQQIRCSAVNGSKRAYFNNETAHAPLSAVSRRNARERKRVRLVNLGFSTLRERVPPGAKNKKLSKVETLRAAIEYIRQLQQLLGMSPSDQFAMDQQSLLMSDENFAQLDDCSSVASSEEIGPSHGRSGQGSEDLSPVSSHPSDCSLMSSPYAPQNSQDDHLADIGLWYS